MNNINQTLFIISKLSRYTALMCRVCVVLRKVSQITIYINTSFLVKCQVCGVGWVEAAGDVGRPDPPGQITYPQKTRKQ